MKRQLNVLLATSGLYMLAAGLFGPIYAIFVKEIGGDILSAGIAYSGFAIAAGVLIFFISRWEDHVKHQEKLITAGYFIGCIGFLGYLFVRTPVHLFIVQVILGIGEAITTPAYDGLYSKHLDKGKFASEWGMWDSLAYITAGIAALAGGFVASIFGFRSLFIIMFVLSLLSFFVSLLLRSGYSRRS